MDESTPLCAVSSLWRTLALATPKLWSRVFVYVPDKSKSKAQLVPWIKRSGSLPLTLFIWYRSRHIRMGQEGLRTRRKGSQPLCVPMGNAVCPTLQMNYMGTPWN
jgi:hypothetical protein